MTKKNKRCFVLKVGVMDVSKMSENESKGCVGLYASGRGALIRPPRAWCWWGRDCTCMDLEELFWSKQSVDCSGVK